VGAAEPVPGGSSDGDDDEEEPEESPPINDGAGEAVNRHCKCCCTEFECDVKAGGVALPSDGALVYFKKCFEPIVN
jgi:hypothetical protein